MTFKQRLENFKYYYKWHTIAGIFIILLLVFAIKSGIDSKEPDINILYVSDKSSAQDAGDRFREKLDKADILTDVNKDGEETFYFDPLVINFDENAGQDFAFYQKLQVQMMAGEQVFMLVHRYVLEDYDGAFEDIGSYAGEYSSYTGTEDFVTGISVQGNSLLEEMGINTENLYAAIHRRTDKQLEKNALENEYKQGYKILELVLENNPE